MKSTARNNARHIPKIRAASFAFEFTMTKPGRLSSRTANLIRRIIRCLRNSDPLPVRIIEQLLQAIAERRRQAGGPVRRRAGRRPACREGGCGPCRARQSASFALTLRGWRLETRPRVPIRRDPAMRTRRPRRTFSLANRIWIPPLGLPCGPSMNDIDVENVMIDEPGSFERGSGGRQIDAPDQ